VNKVTFHDLVCRLKELARELERTPTLVEFVAKGNSKRQINKYKYSEICRAAGLEVNKSPYTTAPVQVQFTPPKVLVFDIEISPIIAKVWGLFDQNIALNQIEQDWFVLSYAAKWLGDDTVHYMDQRYANPLSDDRMLLEGIHHLLSQADWVIGHNIAKFDLKKLNARFICHGLPPLPPFNVIDTLKIAKKHFSITSNKLEYLAKYLKCEFQKSSHSNFSGMELWNEMLKRNNDAFIECESYNKMDVLVTEQVYYKLVPWEPSVNFQAHFGKLVCSCGNTSFFKNGLKYTKQGQFQIFICKDCGKCHISKQNLIEKDIRSEFVK